MKLIAMFQTVNAMRELTFDRGDWNLWKRVFSQLRFHYTVFKFTRSKKPFTITFFDSDSGEQVHKVLVTRSGIYFDFITVPKTTKLRVVK